MASARRTCVVTRTEGDRDTLIRLVAAPDGQLVADLRARLPGRGVWVSPRADVIAKLDKLAGKVRRQLGPVEVDAAALLVQVREGVQRQALDALSLARAGGGIIPGQDRVVQGVMSGQIAAVVLANDLADRTRKMLGATVEREADAVPDGVWVWNAPLDMVALGKAVGRGATGVLGVRDGREQRSLLTRLRRARDLG